MNWRSQEPMNLQDSFLKAVAFNSCIIELECRVAIQRHIENQKEKESLWTNLKEVLKSLLEP